MGEGLGGEAGARGKLDRKSTRLNSSHGYISYAVFCLKKKTTTEHKTSVTAPIGASAQICGCRNGGSISRYSTLSCSSRVSIVCSMLRQSSRIAMVAST